MKRLILLAGIVALSTNSICAAVHNEEDFMYAYNEQAYIDNGYVSGNVVETIYTEVPVQSYYAYPDDPNFIPETEFMNMDNNIDYDQVIYDVRSQEYDYHNGVAFAEKPTVICRDFNCTQLNDDMSRTFLFNSLSNMFLTNAHSRLYLCEADPFSRSCLQSGISFPVRSGIANALIKIPKATISQVSLSAGLSRATVSMNYEFLVNGMQRDCEPTVMDISVPNASQATLINREFGCALTSDGESNVSLLLNVDYIDLDYGLIGGYYSIGMQGPTTGSGSGYLIFKTEFTTNGSKFRAAKYNNNNDSVNRDLKPGEYSVEAWGK